MIDFVEFCMQNELVDVADDGTITWKESAIRGGKPAKHSEKFGGGRDQRDDLSDDYKGHMHHMGTVWPFKVVAKGGKKQAASVAK